MGSFGLGGLVGIRRAEGRKSGMSQRDLMRSLYGRYRKDTHKACREYALAEDRGEVIRKSNKRKMTSLEYARRLLHDGIRKGWISN